TGDKTRLEGNDYHPYRLADKQIITDTLMDQPGHFDPRVTVKLATTSNPTYLNLDDADSVKAYNYYGAALRGARAPSVRLQITTGAKPMPHGRAMNTTAPAAGCTAMTPPISLLRTPKYSSAWPRRIGNWGSRPKRMKLSKMGCAAIWQPLPATSIPAAKAVPRGATRSRKASLLRLAKNTSTGPTWAL